MYLSSLIITIMAITPIFPSFAKGPKRSHEEIMSEVNTTKAISKALFQIEKFDYVNKSSADLKKEIEKAQALMQRINKQKDPYDHIDDNPLGERFREKILKMMKYTKI